MIHFIRAATLPLSRWHNGAGRKSDILTGDGWSIGFAWLDADAPFSRLTGMARTITLVEGPGFTLDVTGTMLPVSTRYVPASFDGGAETQCRIAGPCRVLNAMTGPALRHLVDIVDRSQTIDPASTLACVVVALDGPAWIGAGTLDRLDAASITAPTELQVSPGCRVARIIVADAY